MDSTIITAIIAAVTSTGFLKFLADIQAKRQKNQVQPYEDINKKYDDLFALRERDYDRMLKKQDEIQSEYNRIQLKLEIQEKENDELRSKIHELENYKLLAEREKNDNINIITELRRTIAELSGKTDTVQKRIDNLT